MCRGGSGAPPGHQADGDLDEPEHKRRNEPDDEREQHDLARLRVVVDERVGALAVHREHRLGDREPAGGEQFECGPGLAPQE